MTALLAVALLLAACSSDDGGEGPTRVLLWEFGGVESQHEWAVDAVARFNAGRDDIEVEFATRDWWTQREILISNTIVGEGPDIIRVHHKYSVEFGEVGGLLPLETFSDLPEIRDRFFSNMLDEVKYDGKHFGIPVTVLPFVLAVNRGILDAHGLEVPETWDDVRAMGPVLKASGIHALTMPGGPKGDTSYRFVPLLYKAGGRVLDDGMTRAVFNGPAGVATLEFLVDLKERGFLPEGNAAYAFHENCAHWVSERALLSIEGPWFQNTTSSGYDFDVAKLMLRPLPVPPEPLEAAPSKNPDRRGDGGDPRLHPGAGCCLDGAQGALRVRPGLADRGPGAVGVADPEVGVRNEGVQGYIDIDIMADEGMRALGWPPHPAVSQIARRLAEAVNEAFSETATPKQALDDAARDVDEVLADY